MQRYIEEHRIFCIIAILFLALCIRVYVAFFSGLSWYSADTGSYYSFADSLQKGGYREPFMPPGYSFLIVLLDRFGNRDLSMIIFNIVASLLACLFVYFICYKITNSEKAAILAMIILAVYPNNVNYIRHILTETPTMFFLTASVFFILCFSGSLIAYFLSGLALGMAGIIRLSCLPMIIFPLTASLLDKKYKRAILYLISFALPVIFTLGLNYYNTKRLFIANSLALNFIISVESRSDNIYYDDAKDPYNKKLVRECDARKAAIVYIKELWRNPKEWVIKRIITTWELWGPYPSADGRRTRIIRILIGLRFILFILSAVGGYFLVRRNREQFLILCGPIITITLVHILTYAIPRYTHPVEPLAICLALYYFFGIGGSRATWLKDRRSKRKLSFLAALIFMGIVVFHMGGICAFAQEDKVMRGVIDIHSNVSDGFNSLEKIAELAQEKGLSVLIFGDCALRKWEYGLWPLRNLIKKTYRENSVLRLGTDKYLKSFANLKKEFPDLVLIPGLEASPFFYWEGSPFSKNFVLIDYYKQFLIIGLNPKDYRNLPIVGNRQFLYLSRNGLFGLWPILLIIFGLKIILKKKAWGISLTAIGILFLLNNLPFPTSRFNVYQGNQGIKPYQDLIDYVNKRRGLIFWAHPEMFTQKIYYGIELYTVAHTEDLFLTHDYTGFGVTFNLAEAGGIWDKILLEYIGGKTKKPAWIIAPVHYIGPSTRLDSAETLFFVKEAKQEDVLAALSQGKMYVRFNLGKEPAVLSEFGVRSVGSGSIQVLVKGNQVPSLEPLKIELIRNGQVFRIFEETRSEWMITVEDKLSAQEPKAYYRLRIKSPSSIILSNPIFAGVKN